MLNHQALLFALNAHLHLQLRGIAQENPFSEGDFSYLPTTQILMVSIQNRTRIQFQLDESGHLQSTDVMLEHHGQADGLWTDLDQAIQIQLLNEWIMTLATFGRQWLEAHAPHYILTEDDLYILAGNLWAQELDPADVQWMKFFLTQYFRRNDPFYSVPVLVIESLARNRLIHLGLVEYVGNGTRCRISESALANLRAEGIIQ